MSAHTEQSNFPKGNRLGPYEVISSIGAGGMGEVFRARDTRLNRDVAIKVLPKDFASDADRLRRFEREARTLAALNHPNIMTVFDAGQHEGAPFLVSELLEGRTLREVLGRDAVHGVPQIPLRKATEFALQIAQGLAAAHAKGIIHRDLKPENIFVTRDDRVKILDFGLAKLRAPVAADVSRRTSRPGQESAPTHVGGYEERAEASTNPTQPGMVLGTPAYMSPEQVRGEPADHRADIFAFGCVLYEMLSGTKAFRRETAVESMNAILREEPADLPNLRPDLPATWVRIVHRCLEKAPEQRFQSAADLAFALENARTATSTAGDRAGAGVGPRRGLSLLWPWSVAAAALLAALGIFLSTRQEGGRRPADSGGAGSVRKFALTIPTSEKNERVRVQISPDGNKLAYAGPDGLRLLRLDRDDGPQFLRVASGVQLPFWSPDSTELAFFERRKLYRVPVEGGHPKLICEGVDMEEKSAAGGGAWLEDGRILFTTGNTGLYEVSASGGQATLALKPADGEKDFHDPSPLPDGLGILFVVHPSDTGEGGWKIARWSGRGADKEIVLKDWPALVWRPVYSASGHILFRADGIWALPFSPTGPDRREKAFRIADRWEMAAVAGDGTLVLSAKDDPLFATRQLVWVDRLGKVVGTNGPAIQGLTSPRLSPDQQRVVFAAGEYWSDMGVWVMENSRGIPTRVTPRSLSFSWSPFWLLGGRDVLFSRGNQTLVGSVDGTGTFKATFSRFTVDVSERGQHALLRSEEASHRWSYARILAGESAPLIPFPDHLLAMKQPTLSPDDAWLAYVSADPGPKPAVCVTPFPGLTNRIVVSRNGGGAPRWHPRGGALFFFDASGTALMAARMKMTGTPGFEEPEILFEVPEGINLMRDDDRVKPFDVTADGERFLMMKRVEPESGQRSSGNPNVLIVENWFEEFRQNK